jgi:heterodisulfide reductase subunit D
MTAADSYHLLRDSQRILLTRDEVLWQTQLTGSEPQADIVIDFGCGLQRTPHVMLEMLDVLTALGVHVQAVAGPQWCCGMPVEEDRPGTSVGVTRASVRHLAQFQPARTVQSCGAWWPQTAKLRAAGEDIPFDLVPLPEFIMTSLQRGLDAVSWRDVPTRHALVHLKAQDAAPDVRLERAASLGAADRAIPEILRMIPSVEMVGEVEPPTLGRPCNTDEGEDDRSVLHDLSATDHARVLAELTEQGGRADADLIVCAHHRCAEEWGKFSSDAVEIKHYISVLADAMGLARPNRFHTCWALPSVADIVDETAPAWRSWDLSRDEAESLVTQIFPSHARSRT